MKPKQYTVSVGIPAYNEEANIEQLLSCLLNQTQSHVIIKKIIVSSDGSTDNTVAIVKRMAKMNKKIRYIANKDRLGVAVCENQILNYVKSDAFVLMNADVLPKNNMTIQELVTPLVSGRVDMTTPENEPLRPQTFFEKILFASAKFKYDAYNNYHKGNNIYTCRGTMRCFSRRLYQNLSFTQSVDEDAYTYFACRKLHFTYKFINRAVIYFKLPDNLKDHERQSLRFMQPKVCLNKIFGPEIVKKGYYIPTGVLFRSFVKFFPHYPVELTFYPWLALSMKIKSILKKPSTETWDIAVSSKTLTVPSKP